MNHRVLLKVIGCILNQQAGTKASHARCGEGTDAYSLSQINIQTYSSLYHRTCMEFDKISRVCLSMPPDLHVGDFMLITGAGAYDVSMSYSFGDGLGREMINLQ